jgi:hypothetical protein
LVEHAGREYLGLHAMLAAEIVRHARCLGSIPVDTASQNAHQPPRSHLPPMMSAPKLDLNNRITLGIINTLHIVRSLMLRR